MSTEREKLIARLQDELEYRVRTAVARWNAARRLGQKPAVASEAVQEEVTGGRARIAALAAPPVLDEAWIERVNRALFSYDNNQEFGVREVAAALGSPLLDEEKIAEVIRLHSRETKTEEGHPLDRDTVCAECGYAFRIAAENTAPPERERRKYEHIARVVAEWLRGESRG